MRKLLLLLLLGVLLSQVTAYASIYGTVRGKVVDEEGRPAVGASVRIEGQRVGGTVRGDGNFQVLNINPGLYVVVISNVGYRPYRVEVRITADDVTNLGDIKLVPESIQMEETTIIGDRLMVDKHAVGRTQRMTSEELQLVAREGVSSIVGLSAGVFAAGGGFNVRGSRTSETQIRVDGLDVGNQFTGGFGLSGLNYYPMVSTFATEEVQVITGGFSAEYGSAMGGVVNTVIKTGRSDKYEGFVRWRTDVPTFFGSQKDKLKLVEEGNRLRPVNDGPGYKLQGSDEHTFEFGFGGPLPLVPRATFFLTSSYFYEKYRGASYEITDPVGNNIGLLPNNQSWKKNITGRMKFGILRDVDLIVGGSFGMTNLETSSWGWMYANTPGADVGQDYPGSVASNFIGLPESFAKQPVTNQLVSNVMARIQHRLSDNSFYTLTLSNTSNDDAFAKRASANDPGFFSGFDLWYPQDDYEVVFGGRLVPGKDKVVDQFTPVSFIGYSRDGYYLFDKPMVNPLTGFLEGPSSAASSDNPYGIPFYFTEHGNDRTFNFRKGNYWQVDGNYTLSLLGEFTHMIKAGFEFRYYELHRHNNSLPWDGNPFYDVYTDLWGGNLYAEEGALYEKTSKPFHPIRGSMFVQDQISYKGVIISPGLRLDFFDPRSEYRQQSTSFIPATADTGFYQSTMKYQLSPRINVSYPITDRSIFSIAYGLYFQMPEMQYMYDGFSVSQLRGNAILGDPNMDAQRTNQYQVNFNQQLTDDMAFDVSAYYKDIYNQIGAVYVPTTPTPFYQYAVSEYGNAKGLEFTLRKRPTNHFGFNLNYNLAYAAGTSSSPGDNYLNPVDPFTGRQAFPLTEFPFSYDRRHRINLTMNLVWFRGQGPSIGNIKILENTQFNISGFFQTGVPYTRLDYSGKPIGEFNAERQPSFYRLDLRFQRGVYLADLFGDAAGNASIEFFVDVNNLINTTAVAGYFARSGDPDDDGINFYRKASDFSAIAYYREASYAKAESWSSDQYSGYGERYYNVNADYDRNGIVTQDEKFESFKRYLEDARKFRGNYQAPRTVYLGVMFRL